MRHKDHTGWPSTKVSGTQAVLHNLMGSLGGGHFCCNSYRAVYSMYGKQKSSVGFCFKFLLLIDWLLYQVPDSCVASMSNVCMEKHHPGSCETFPREGLAQLSTLFRYLPHEGFLSLSHDSELPWPWVPHPNLECCLFLPKYVWLCSNSFPCLCWRIWFSFCE